MSLSESQLYVIAVIERTCSSVSLIGTSIIISTFLGSALFRKPINRLVFYACWGNMLSNVATLMSYTVSLRGAGSPLCQFQGFLIQWFMPADALWTFAMACNVYLTFFHKFSAPQLRQLEWKYFVLCYGLPFIPAFTYFFIKTNDRGAIYGSAILWCWVSLPWDFLRIAVFYGPVWFVILITFAIYIRAGNEIYRNRIQLQKITSGDPGSFNDDQHETPMSKVTEIRITREVAALEQNSPRSEATEEGYSTDQLRAPCYNPYSVTVETGDSRDSMTISLKKTPGHADHNGHHRTAKNEVNASAWAYSKYAMLYFVALLVTWVPSTINRVYSFARPHDNNFSLELLASLVLPLQGFWNSIIYVAVSWPSVKELLRRLRRARS